MKNFLRFGLAAALLGAAFPSQALTGDDPAAAESAAAPIRERLLNRMEGWRKVLFPVDELLANMTFPDKPLPDAVAREFEARYDALEKTVRGQHHPGDIYRSKYAFQELLDDALHARHRETKRANPATAGFKDYRAEKTALVESAAVLAEAQAPQKKAEDAAAAIAGPPEALPELPEPRSSSTLFDGSSIGTPVSVEPFAAPTTAPLAYLPSRPIAAWTLVAPPKSMPSGAAASAQRTERKGRPAVEYDNGVTHVGGDRNWRNNNPGNIRSGDWAKDHGAIGAEGGFAIFPSAAAGRRALDELLSGSKYRNLTLERAVSRYAPPSENPTQEYVAFLSRMAGVKASTKLSDFTAKQLAALKLWISSFEGTRTGQVVKNDA
jgi:hypothetical protein